MAMLRLAAARGPQPGRVLCSPPEHGSGNSLFEHYYSIHWIDGNIECEGIKEVGSDRNGDG